MKKKIVFSFILGILISSGAYAAVSLSSDKISYKDTTVAAALDNLFNESASGKAKIAEAITNKGIETLNTDSYDKIVSNINNISTGNKNLRFDEESGYIQAINTSGNWVNVYQTSKLPLPSSIKWFDYGPISGYTWLFRNGNNTSDSRYIGSAAGSVESQDIYTTAKASSSSQYVSWKYGFYSNQSIDVTSFNKMTVIYNATVNGTYGGCSFGLSELKSIAYDWNTSFTYGKYFSSSSTGTATIDISDASGEMYFHGFASGGGPGGTSKLIIYSIILSE